LFYLVYNAHLIVSYLTPQRVFDLYPLQGEPFRVNPSPLKERGKEWF
jgi:hypothetical protein